MLILLTTGTNPAGLLIAALAYVDQWHEMAKMPLLLYIKTKIVKDQSRLSCIQLGPLHRSHATGSVRHSYQSD